MRKTLFFLVFVIIVLFSGCSKAESDEPYTESSTFDSYVAFSISTLTYTDIGASDVLFGVGDVTTDYLINAANSQELSSTQQDAYVSVLSVLEEINSNDNTFNYFSIPSYTSKEIEAYADAVGIELTVTDIITYNSIKSEVEEQWYSSYISILSKEDYVELRIGRELTSVELEGFYTLQEHYDELIVTTDTVYSFETNTFAALLLLFNDELGYIPLDEMTPKLEAAYNVLHMLLTD